MEESYSGASIINRMIASIAPAQRQKIYFNQSVFYAGAISGLGGSGLKQIAGRIIGELVRFLDIALHRTVMPPAAMALDIQEIGAGPVSAGSQTTSKTMAAEFRRIRQLYCCSAGSQDS